MASKKKSSGVNRLALLFVLLVLGAVLVTIFYKVNQHKTNQEIRTSEEETVLEGLSTELKANAAPREYGYDDWITDGKRLPLKSQQIVLGTNGTNGVGKYGGFTTDELDNVNEEFISALQGKISTYFINKGFRLNESNTNLIPSDYYFSTIAFEKGNLKCLSHVAKQSDPFGYITCGTINNKQIMLQKELNSVYLEQVALNRDQPITFRVDLMTNDFASGSVSAGVGGYQWLAKNIQGAWTTIWSGQEIPMCSDMAKYEVPKEFYPGCYNPETQQEQRTY